GLAFAPDGKSVLAAHVVRRPFPVSKGNIDNGWVIDSRLARLPLTADANPDVEQVALDTRGKAVGDPHGLAFDPTGRTLVVSAGGPHELLLFRADSLPWAGGFPGDFIDHPLTFDDGKFRRLTLGGRPLALAFLPRSADVVVANYLLDAVQVVDAKAGKLKST